MSLIRGENVIVAEYIALVDAFVLYGCARTCDLVLDTEFLETSVTGSGKFASFLPAKMSFVGNISGLVSLNESNLLSLPDLRAKQLAQEKLIIRYARTALDGSIYNEQGSFYIKSSTDEGPHDGINTFGIVLQGTGALVQDFTPTEILANVKRFEYTGTGGEVVFTNVKDVATGNTITLAGKTVLGFEKDGVGYSKMVTAGTPAGKEFKFNSVTGQITIAIPFEPDEEAFGYYR